MSNITSKSNSGKLEWKVVAFVFIAIAVGASTLAYYYYGQAQTKASEASSANSNSNNYYSQWQADESKISNLNQQLATANHNNACASNLVDAINVYRNPYSQYYHSDTYLSTSEQAYFQCTQNP